MRVLKAIGKALLALVAILAIALFAQPVLGQVAAPAVPVQVPAPADEARPDFKTFVADLKQQALTAGVSEATASAALDALEPLEVVVERDRSQPETVLTTQQYVQRRLTPAFVRMAVDRSREHRELLAPIAKKYGVPASVLVAIWGMESNFGRFMGTRPIVQALRSTEQFRRFRLEHDTLVWPNDMDLAPEYLFFLTFRNDPAYAEQFRRWGYLDA